MNLLSIASAVPRHRFRQEDCLAAAQESEAFRKLSPAALRLFEKVLSGDSGIEERGFVFPDLDGLFGLGVDQLNQAFEREAPALAGEALSKALDRAGLRAEELDALLVCTCTGYLCPGPSSHIAESLGLRSDAFLSDLVGLGCGAALPLLRNAAGFVAANSGAKVATIAVEICSAAFYAEESPDQIISLCLFGDAASASIWSDSGGDWKLGEFDTVHRPEHREKIRFVSSQGHLKNQLDRSVPRLSAEAVADLRERRAGGQATSEAVVLHGGGRDVLREMEQLFPEKDLAASWNTLRENGNCSSPSVLMALEELLADSHPEDWSSIWMSSFGAGFAAHSARLVGTGAKRGARG